MSVDARFCATGVENGCVYTSQCQRVTTSVSVRHGGCQECQCASGVVSAVSRVSLLWLAADCTVF